MCLTAFPVGFNRKGRASTQQQQIMDWADQGGNKDFNLLKSLRLHFAALDQQNPSSHPPQQPVVPGESWTLPWVQACQLQPHATPQPIPTQNSSRLPAEMLPHSTHPARTQDKNLQLASHIKKSFRSSTIPHKSKVKHRKQHQHHKQSSIGCRQVHLPSNSAAASLQLVGNPQGRVIHHAKSVPSFFQQNLANSTSTEITLPKEVHHLQDACMDQPLEPDQHEAPYLLCKAHKSSSLGSSQMSDAQRLITEQATAPVSNVCIRAKPKQAWQRTVKPASGIYEITDLCLGHIQGRQPANTFQIASELGKAGQVRTQNLHAAVKASKQLMHRFVVRQSAVAHMGVFTKGAGLTLCLKLNIV